MNNTQDNAAVKPKPRSYRFKKWIQLILIVEIVHLILRVLHGTLRYRYVGAQNAAWAKSLHPNNVAILACWHETCITGMFSLRHARVASIVSASYEGEIAVRVSNRLDVHCIRGSSTRGGRAAIVECGKRIMEGDSVGITVDGPRGPRHVPKPGVVSIASRYRVAIIPYYTSADRYWALKTWDKLRIPKPFSIVTISYGEPIVVPPETSEQEFDQFLKLLTERIEDLEAAVHNKKS